jgi:phage antirepressor YoqD-like protein
MHNNIPYQSYQDQGWFRVIEQKYTKPNGETLINLKTVVFQKGVDGIRKLLEKEVN